MGFQPGKPPAPAMAPITSEPPASVPPALVITTLKEVRTCSSSSSSSTASSPPSTRASSPTPTPPPSHPTSTAELLSEEAIDAEKAAQYTHLEHSMTFGQALRQHWPAVLSAFVINLATVCQGLDGSIVGSLVGIGPFKQRYGALVDGEWVIAAGWVGAFNYSHKVGAMVGSFCAGIAYDRLGLRRVLGLCSALSIGFLFVQFFAVHPAMLVMGVLLNGSVVSFYAVVAAAYVGEVCPGVLRGVTASAINLLFVAGQLLAAGVIRGADSVKNEWAFKLAIASQWVLPLVMLVFTLTPWCFDPPYWLVKHGKFAEAERCIKRLATPGVDPSLKLSYIRHTLRHEDAARQPDSAEPGLRDCFRAGPDRRRLLICVGVYAAQALVGSVVFHDFALYFFELTGLSTRAANNMNVALNGVGFVACCLAGFVMQRLGRRPAYILGCVGLALLQGLMGVVDLASATAAQATGQSSWIIAGLCMACNFVYDITVGPYCFVLLSEVSSVRLRGINIGLASLAYQLSAIVLSVIVPFLVNEDELALRGKIGFVFAVTAGLMALVCYLYLPETRGRTFEELDHMFTSGVSARKFGAYKTEYDLNAEGKGGEKDNVLVAVGKKIHQGLKRSADSVMSLARMGKAEAS